MTNKMVRVQGTQTVVAEVCVTEEAILEMAADVVKRRAWLKPGQWVNKEDQVCEERHTSHSYTAEVGPAQPSQINAQRVATYLSILVSGHVPGGV